MLSEEAIQENYALFKKYIYGYIKRDGVTNLLNWLDTTDICYAPATTKYYGVYPTSLPRDAFNNDNFQDGLSFSINFKAAFYEDMRPEILFDFNKLSKPIFGAAKYRIDVYNDIFMRHDGRAAKAAAVYMVQGDKRALQNPNQYYYKLVWKGDDTV